MTVGPLLMAVGALMLLLVSTDFDYWWQVLPAMIVMRSRTLPHGRPA